MRLPRAALLALAAWGAGCRAGPGEDGLYGTTPLDPIPAPVFEVTADDGTPRDRDDLLGHATVMWFYPAAATSG